MKTRFMMQKDQKTSFEFELQFLGCYPIKKVLIKRFSIKIICFICFSETNKPGYSQIDPAQGISTDLSLAPGKSQLGEQSTGEEFNHEYNTI